MKQRLLQHLSLAKPLRLALVLFTLLLTLPQTAWGQGQTEVLYTFGSLPNENGGLSYVEEGKYTISSTSGEGWTITNLVVNPNRIGWVASSDSLKISNITYYDSGSTDPATTVSFDLLSDFTLTGEFVSAEITYSTNKINNKSVTIFRNEGTSNSNLTQDDGLLTSTPASISLSPTYTVNKYFNGNKIAFHFSFTTVSNSNQNDGSFTIQSIKITTYDTYGLTVAGTVVSAYNATNVLGENTATVSYDATTNTLTLNGADLTTNGSDHDIRYNGTENLTIALKGDNKASKIQYYPGTGTSDLLFTKATGATDCSLLLTQTYSADASVIERFKDIDFGPFYTKANDQITEVPSHYVYRYSTSPADGKFLKSAINDNRNINELLITTAKYYQLWVGGIQVSEANKGEILGNGNTTASFDGTSTLTLNAATVNNPIISNLGSLTISLSGNNTVTSNISDISPIFAIAENTPLSFVKAAVCQLNLAYAPANNVQMVKGFTSVSHADLYFVSKTGTTIDGATTYDATLSSEIAYPLWVAGTLVTDANKGDILGAVASPTATFAISGETKTLTLNSANITGIIESALGDLTIRLTGDNILKAPATPTSTITSLIKSYKDGTLKFETDANAIGSLSFKTAADAAFADPIGGFTKVEYGNGLDYSATDSKVGLTIYPLSIGGTYVNSQNKTDFLGNGNGEISYNSESNTLTLNGATIDTDGGIFYDGTTNLTIALNGTNIVDNSNMGTYAIATSDYTSGLLKFEKAAGASSAELTLKSGLGATQTISAGTPTLGSGLYWKPLAANNTIITDNPEFVIVGDYVITASVAGDQGEVRYDATNKILTLDGYSKAYATGKHAIKTGVTDLKVKLIGENTISCISDSAIFYPFSNSASIQLVKNDNTSKLTMTGKALDYFAADKISYDGLVYYSANNYIAIPIAPTMDVNIDNKVVLTADYSGGTIAFKYSIDYADETADVTDATYSAPFEMAAPGTVTAWVEANGTTTSTVKGKKFGYQGAPFSMMVNDVKTPVLIPAIEAGDDIVYDSSTPYASNDASVATFENGNITAHAIGTATLTTRLGYNTNNVPATKLLNYDGQFTTQLTVSKVFNIAFAEGANYMTYYNIDAEDLTIPDGMTAAIVTGVASSGTTVETTALSYIPGRTAILLGKGTSTGTPSVTKYIGKDPAPTGNKLKYVEITPQTTTGYEYVLYKDEFVKATGSIPDGKCYLDLTGAAPAPARSLGIDSDGTTDIRELRMENEERDEWYDLQGRRIEQPTKAGLYIKNGKKVIVNTK